MVKAPVQAFDGWSEADGYLYAAFWTCDSCVLLKGGATECSWVRLQAICGRKVWQQPSSILDWSPIRFCCSELAFPAHYTVSPRLLKTASKTRLMNLSWCMTFSALRTVLVSWDTDRRLPTPFSVIVSACRTNLFIASSTRNRLLASASRTLSCALNSGRVIVAVKISTGRRRKQAGLRIQRNNVSNKFIPCL